MKVHFGRRACSTEVAIENVDSQETSDAATCPTSSTTPITKPRNPADLTVRQSILPLSLVITLFFVWGFCGGLSGVLNKKFQDVLHLSKTQSTGLQIAFSSAYAIGPPTYSAYLLRRVGYRWTLTFGLIVFGIGTLCFWPSGKYESFGGFCGASFVVGSGAATLATAAHPYVSICGPEKYSAIRINLAEAIQSAANVIALVLASYVILDDVSPKGAPTMGKGATLESVQLIYLGVGLFVFVLALLTYFMPIVEISDEDLEGIQRQRRAAKGIADGVNAEKSFWKQYILFFAVFAGACGMGAQGSIQAFFINYALEVKPDLSEKAAAHKLVIASSVFAVSRFIATFLMTKIKPRYILLASGIGGVSCLAAAMGTKGTAGIAMMMIEAAFRSAFFPTLFSLALKGLGKHTKRASGFIVASVSGAALFAPAMGAAADAMGTQKALFVPLIAVAIATSYPIYLNLRGDASHCDPDIEDLESRTHSDLTIDTAEVEKQGETIPVVTEEEVEKAVEK